MRIDDLNDAVQLTDIHRRDNIYCANDWCSLCKGKECKTAYTNQEFIDLVKQAKKGDIIHFNEVKKNVTKQNR